MSNLRQGSMSLSSKLSSMRHANPNNPMADVLSKMSKLSVKTMKESDTSSHSTPKSARLMYLSTLIGRTLGVLRPHPRNMVDSLIQMADEVECIPSVKKALVSHVKEIEKLVISNRKAGAMMNKTMMYWRMLLKPKAVEDIEVMRMIDDVETKMARIRYKLDLADSKQDDELLQTSLYQCYLDDGLRIILFDSNENIKDYVQSASKMRKSLRSLQRKVNMSEYFENVKEWVMDAAVTCYVIMAIDTVTALKLHPLIKELAKNVKDGSIIETQFVNRLRTFNVCLYRVLAEAKMRRCQTLGPLDEMLAKMAGLDNMVAHRPDPEDDGDVRAFLEKLGRIDKGWEEQSDVNVSRDEALKLKTCDHLVLRDRYKKITPTDLYPPFV